MQENDPEGWWQESFKAFTDSKPKGPQAISLDIAFPGSQHVYGIPEHARRLSLTPTKGLSHPFAVQAVLAKFSASFVLPDTKSCCD